MWQSFYVTCGRGKEGKSPGACGTHASPMCGIGVHEAHAQQLLLAHGSVSDTLWWCSGWMFHHHRRICEVALQPI
jgi:hypothetical protein